MKKITNTHTNTTQKYQLIGNAKDIVAEGTKEEMIEKMDSTSIYGQWCVLEVVEPGQTISVDLVTPEPHKSDDTLLDQLWGLCQ